MSSNHKVRIAARLRPPLPGEQRDDGVYVKHGQTPRLCVTHPRDPTKNMEYPLNSCYDHEATQGEIFANDVHPLIDVVFSGSTVTVFAYGVTSSGKTHTMQGSASQPGIIPRTVEAIFERSVATEHKVNIEMSYFEIYKDECYDLLVPRDKAPKLPVREDATGQVVVAGLEKISLESNADFSRTYTAANEQRSVGATNLNRESSRSHAILTLEVKMHKVNETKLLTGKIHLVDLAGSENNKRTGNDAARMQESSAINKSLSVLGQVVHALNRGDTRIPYRNAKLTRILQDALGGKSVGLLICNLAPGTKFRQDTFNTLNFATRTSIIENKPVIDEQDTKPASKSHFAAPPPPAARLAPLPSLPASKSTAVLARPQGSRSRPSLSFSRIQSQPPLQAGPSRVPRKSHAGLSNPYPDAQARKSVGHTRAALPSVGEEDIDDKIAKAVEVEVAKRIEIEVAKRIAAFEKQRLEEDKERVGNESADKASTAELSLMKDASLPPDMLAPLLKRHEDLDAELRRRLEELETMYERNSSHAQAAQGLSPMSRKKTGRAYVSLARAHSEKGELQIALDLYRKAETYVPDNVKLKERILEIEWSVKNGRPFQPSPKRPRKTKTKKAKKAVNDEQLLAVQLPAFAADSDAPSAKGDSDDENTVESILQPPDIIVQSAGGRVTRSMKACFGTEATNSPEKRGMDQNDDGEHAHTPPKRSRHTEGIAAPMVVPGTLYDTL